MYTLIYRIIYRCCGFTQQTTPTYTCRQSIEDWNVSKTRRNIYDDKKKEERRAANAWQQKTIKINLRSYQETVYKNKPPHVRLYVFVSLYKNKLIKTTNEIYIETKSSMKYGRSCSGKMNKNKFYLWPHFVYAISENFESKTTKNEPPVAF